MIKYMFICLFFILVPTQPPSNLMVEKLHSTNVTLSWNNLPSMKWNGKPHHYNITLHQSIRNGSIRILNHIVEISRHDILIHNLVPFTNCSVFLTACTAIGCSKDNAVIYFTTLEAGSCCINYTIIIVEECCIANISPS